MTTPAKTRKKHMLIAGIIGLIWLVLWLAFKYKAQVVSTFRNIMAKVKNTVVKNEPADLSKNNQNNPMAVIKSDANDWQGEVPSKTRFEAFKAVEYGLRAGMYLLLQYQTKYGLKTLRALFEKWAPVGDGSNNPLKYAQGAAAYLGFGIDTQFTFNKEILCALTEHICKIETGGNFIPSGRQLDSAIALLPNDFKSKYSLY